MNLNSKYSQQTEVVVIETTETTGAKINRMGTRSSNNSMALISKSFLGAIPQNHLTRRVTIAASNYAMTTTAMSVCCVRMRMTETKTTINPISQTA